MKRSARAELEFQLTNATETLQIIGETYRQLQSDSICDEELLTYLKEHYLKNVKVIRMLLLIYEQDDEFIDHYVDKQFFEFEFKQLLASPAIRTGVDKV